MALCIVLKFILHQECDRGLGRIYVVYDNSVLIVDLNLKTINNAARKAYNLLEFYVTGRYLIATISIAVHISLTALGYAYDYRLILEP